MNAAVLQRAAPRAAPVHHPRALSRQLTNALALCLLATVFTIVNCAKAIHIDDAAYVAYAAHIAEDPLKPYDFEVYWGFQLQPANHLLAPPVLPYWIAASMGSLGQEPWVWKLALWPLHLLLVVSLFAVFRRFARDHAMPLVWMTVMSPALLPSSNLMLDVPALALSTAALAVFFRAADRGSWTLAVAAGLLAGLAMQTKYTALVTPVVFVAWGATQGRMRLAWVAAALSVAVFAVWEGFVIWQHGESHFLHAMQNRPGSSLHRVRHLIMPLISMSAALAPGALLTAVYGGSRSTRYFAGLSAALVSGLLVLGAVPHEEGVLYGILAVAWWLVLAAVCFRLWKSNAGRGTLIFLGLWLALEIAGALAMSPFPAARRVLGIVLVSTLVVGRFAGALPRGPLWMAAGLSAAFGLAIASIDVLEADAPRQAAERVAAVAHDHPGATTWFSGAWGFQFYAKRQGFQPLLPFASPVKRGDLIALAEQPLKRIDFHLESCPVELRTVVEVQDDLPWQTVLCYYCGSTPIRHLEGPRIRVTVYRALEDFVPGGQGEIPPLR